MTFFYDLNKRLQQALDTSKSDHMQLNENAAVQEGRLGDVARKVGSAVKTGAKAVGKAIVGMDDDELLKDLQKKAGIPAHAQHGKKNMAQSNEGVDKEAFAALAEPKDKITFADKIAGAKKEVDEMLGDVAAEAMKSALSGHGSNKKKPQEEGWDDMMKAVKDRADKPKVGTITHGAKHDVEEIPGGRRVTRRVDPSGISVGADDEAAQSGEKRGRGRPKGPAKAPERVTAKATKHKGGRKMTKEDDNESDDIKQAMAMLKKAGYKVSKAADGAEQVDEKAVSKAQQKFMGMVHATQKGEKAPSKEVAKVAKSMKKSDAEDFAATKHKGLPEKKKPEGKKKEVEETSDNKSSGGMTFGKGIYDSLNRDLELMIAESMSRLDESMSVNMSMSNEGGMNGGASKTLTVTATDDDAVTLASLLKSAGLGGAEQGGCGCGGSPCSCGSNAEVVDENQPDWPTNTETSDDAMQYSGGLNKPKSTGQTTVPVIASQSERQGMTEDMQADDGVPYQSSDDFFSQFEAGHFDDEQVSPDGMEVRGYIDGKNVMVWRFDDESKTSGYGKYDDSALDEQQSYAEAEEDALHRMMEMAGIEFTEEMLEEGWKEKLGAAGLAGAMALGSLGAGAAQAAPQQGLGATTTATQQQTQDIWMPAYKRALSLSSATKNPEFKQELDKLSQFYQDQSGRIGVSGKLSKNMDPKASQDQKQLDLKYKDRLEQLTQRYGANESMQEEDAIKRMMEMAGVKKKEVDEEKTDEGNKFTGNLAKARAAGKKEADLDGDGDMEKVQESILSLTNLWKAYKG